MASLWELLRSNSLPNRRVAATALGEIGDATSIPHIFQTLTKPADDHLYHALVYALIEIGDAESIAKGLAHADPRVQHAALVALDQIDAALEREQVMSLLTTTDPMLQAAALQIITSQKRLERRSDPGTSELGPGKFEGRSLRRTHGEHNNRYVRQR